MGRAYDIEGVQYPGVTTILGETMDKSGALLGWATQSMEAHILAALIPDKDGYIDDSSIPEIVNKARYEYKNIVGEACDIGTEAHDLIEQHIKTGKPVFGEKHEEAATAFIAFLDWEKENGVVWLASERKIWSHVHGFAGTLDAICLFTKGEYAGKICVIDFKSSKGFYDGYDEQIAAYRCASDEMGFMFEDSLLLKSNDVIKDAYHFSVEGGDTVTFKPKCKIIPNSMGVLRCDKLTGIPEFKPYDNYPRKLASFLKRTELYYLAKNRRLKKNPFVLANKEAFA